jgi:hypothetical protein|tara:strand:- start:106 stop:408 length:303 start_codon:yes stop_codon:yes gene_type:complete
MKIKLTKNISCTNPIACTERIKKILVDKFGESWDDKNKTSSWHLSIFHKNNNHTIWLFFYEKNGIHESENHGKTITRKADHIIKYSGKMPTLKDIPKLET